MLSYFRTISLIKTSKKERRTQSFKLTIAPSNQGKPLLLEPLLSIKSGKENDCSPKHSFWVSGIESKGLVKKKEWPNVGYQRRGTSSGPEEEKLLQIRFSEINLSENKEESQFLFIKNLITKDWLSLNLNSPLNGENQTKNPLAVINEESQGNSSASFFNNISIGLDFAKEKQSEDFHCIYRNN